MTTNDTEVAGWIQGRLPDAWFTGAAEVTADREEILVVGTLAAPEGVEGEPDGAEATAAAKGRISRFREDTRDDRIHIAREAEHRFGRKIAWGAECGPVRVVFTNLARLEVEVMFNAIADRMPEISRTGDAVRLRHGWINGIKHLPVKYA